MEEKTFFENDWKSIERLGEGSFGIVYKAVKEQYGVKSYSAIKQIQIPQTDKDYSKLRSQGMTQSDIEKSYDSQAKKWIEEIEFLNQFKDNENIVSIEDFEVLERKDKPGRTINIRMELLQNIDDHVMDRTITDKNVLKMASDILKALEECEEKNVVHRDIKPENVFVNSRGTYKLGDFGEAKSIEKTVSNMSKKGTENYMAPEIYKGERGSRSVDTYSLGIMLYKYFNNNRLPFIPDYPNPITFEDMENALLKRMSGEEMKPPVKASNNIARIILKACRYKPADRYKSAMEFRNDIEEELRAITEPIKLFDFQEGKIEKENSELEFDETVGLFHENSNIQDNHNKTVGIFADNKTEDGYKEKPLQKEKSIDTSIKEKVYSDEELKKTREAEQNKNNISDTQKELNKKKIINTIIAIITVIMIFTIIIVNTSNMTSNNDDEYIELEVTEGMKKIEYENLSLLIPNEFEISGENSYSNKTYKNIKERNTVIDLNNSIRIDAKNINNIREDLRNVEAYIKSYCMKEDEKNENSDIQDKIINEKNWKTVRITSVSEYSVAITEYYVILYENTMYCINCKTYATLDYKDTMYGKRGEHLKNDVDMTVFDKIINSFTLNKKTSNIKTFANLKLTIPEDVDFYEIAWYTKKETDEINMINYPYSVHINVYGINSISNLKDRLRNYMEREKKYNSTVESSEENINGLKWTKLKAYNKDKGEMKYYYGIEKDKITYIIEFTLYASRYGGENKNEIKLDGFESFVNSIKNTLEFELI